MKLKDKKTKLIDCPLEPRLDYVVVRKLRDEERTPGGILLPESARTKKEVAVVLAVGPGMKTSEGVLIETGLEPGQKVLVTKFGGHEVTFDNEDLTVVRSNEVVAILKD